MALKPRSRSLLLFVSGAILAVAPVLASLIDPAGPVSAAGVRSFAEAAPASGPPPAFRITPPRRGSFFFMDAVYNSRTDRHVVFYLETALQDTVYSRVFSAGGRALGGPVKILETNPRTIGWLRAAYNPVTDAILMAGGEGAYDEVKGIPLDGAGRLRGGKLTVINIKPATTGYSALMPRVYWLAATNQYAVTWGHSWWEKPLDPLNGHYLAVLDEDFALVSGPRHVRQQTAKNENCFAFLCPVEDGLLWGSAQDGVGRRVNPVVWLTNFKGKLMTGFGTKGFAYPEGTGAFECFVRPVRDTDTGLILLTWQIADSLFPWDQKTSLNHYRLMNPDGSFKTPIKKIPKRQAFQTAPLSAYLASEKRYILVCPEYEDLGDLALQRFNYKGQLWGYYLSAEGAFEAKGGAPGASPVALTPVFKDPKLGLRLATLTGPARDGSLFIAYELAVSNTRNAEAWGLIYK